MTDLCAVLHVPPPNPTLAHLLTCPTPFVCVCSLGPLSGGPCPFSWIYGDYSQTSLSGPALCPMITC